MKKLTDEQKSTIVSLYKSAISIGKIAAQTGHGVNTVARVLDENGVKRSKNLFTPEIEKQIVVEYKTGESLSRLGRKYGASLKTIANILERHGESRRNRGNQIRILGSTERDAILTSWRNGASRESIKQRLGGVSSATLNRWLIELGETPQERGAKGSKHGNWKGGRLTTVHGYNLVWLPRDDVYYCMTNSMGYVPEHRLVVAQWLGRPLLDTEVVHHRNGNRSDNKLENLQLLLGNHSRGQAYCCAECGSLKLNPVDIDK